MKAVGPDGITERVLKECAVQLSGVFTKLSTCPCQWPSTWQSSEYQRITAISSLNDYWAVALTPVILKCFERLVEQYINSNLPNTFDPCQFAYRANRSTEDRITIALHTALLHLKQQGNYVKGSTDNLTNPSDWPDDKLVTPTENKWFSLTLTFTLSDIEWVSILIPIPILMLIFETIPKFHCSFGETK